MVRPMMASESPKIKPNVLGHSLVIKSNQRKGVGPTWRTLTTSSAIAMIQTIETKKPIEQRVMRPVALRPVSAKIMTSTPAASPTIKVAMIIQRAYRVPPATKYFQILISAKSDQGTYQIKFEHRTVVRGRTARRQAIY